MARRLANLVAFDDAPFPRGRAGTPRRGDVPVVGVVYASLRLDGVLVGKVRRDGANAARQLARLVAGSPFADHVQLVLLQGIALAGFNVVDVGWLHRQLGRPVLVVTRDEPDYAAVRRALLRHVPGGRRKWGLVERLGPMEPLRGLYVQRQGLTLVEAAAVIDLFAVHGRIPEPLRAAHLIAGALVRGHSRGRP